MPRIIETIVYELHELPDPAKERARSWYRDNCLHDHWYDYVYEDFQIICKILGLSLKTSTVALLGGKTREQPNIYFTGFWSQGDGACFEANYCHAKNSANEIRAHAPKDTTLHEIADQLLAAQRPNFYQLIAEIRHRGRYSHEHSMTIDVDRNSHTYQPPTPDSDTSIADSFRNLALWLYHHLESEYDSITSDDAVDDTIAVNQYTFTTEGQRFG